MLRIRLRRIGKKGQAYYRVVVADQRAKRDGAFLESMAVAQVMARGLLY